MVEAWRNISFFLSVICTCCSVWYIRGVTFLVWSPFLVVARPLYRTL